MKVNPFFYSQAELKSFCSWLKRMRKMGVAVEVTLLDDLSISAVTDDGRVVVVRPWMARDILEQVYAEMA